ncbi:MAG: enoyl-CoA hydratase/isomerase family protein [Proteobacteria bacterium]|nr:enoyl-CoA hydratase/isomerase family protein [Pseudomonadota bacterium]
MHLVTERRGHILWARLNRPERLNALSSTILDGFLAVADEVAGNIDIRCLVITGSGRSFCAGADLKERGGLDADDRWRYVRKVNEVVAKLDEVPVPVIAAINGYAMGGGVEVVAISDFRLASKSAVFGLPEVRRGIIAGGSIVRLVRDVSPALAARLCYTGDNLGAEEALRLGLVDGIYEDVVQLEQGVQALAERIARNAPLALRASKRLMRGTRSGFSSNAMTLALEIRAPLEDTADSREGLRAFAEKREPVFQGR